MYILESSFFIARRTLEGTYIMRINNDLAAGFYPPRLTEGKRKNNVIDGPSEFNLFA
ncbi:hypothetical protein OF830_25420 [Bacillus paramycoides]|uniref:hypothetical protein n=1 Tax=Bacillus paramycoides TaxID=2026194 RepID=UPI0022446676|nr:hypothetical protein [Bacillus paramycoides]MCW9134135.1 hypothetical protein [Bacillus paramycoides]